MQIPRPADSSDRIIYVALSIASVFGLASFFWQPKYEKGVWAIVSVVTLVVTSVMSFKFGVHQVQPPPGTDQVVHTQTPPLPTPVDASPDKASHETADSPTS